MDLLCKWKPGLYTLTFCIFVLCENSFLSFTHTFYTCTVSLPHWWVWQPGLPSLCQDDQLHLCSAGWLWHPSCRKPVVLSRRAGRIQYEVITVRRETEEAVKLSTMEATECWKLRSIQCYISTAVEMTYIALIFSHWHGVLNIRWSNHVVVHWLALLLLKLGFVQFLWGEK